MPSSTAIRTRWRCRSSAASWSSSCWRSCCSGGTRTTHEAHSHTHTITATRRSGALIVVGDTIHNFLDGILIAAAFLQSTQLGIITALAIVAHEIPQEVGDFLILLNSGYSKAKAFVLNMLSSCATLVGGVLGYYTLQVIEGWTPILLGIVAASMIYVAVADLIPGLHRRPELRATRSQTVLIALGIGSIALLRAAGPALLAGACIRVLCGAK